LKLVQSKRITIMLIVLGGIFVLGSYVHGVVVNPDKASALWGGVPQNLLPAYTASMFLSAAGYLLFTYFLLFRTSQLGLNPDFRIYAVIYAFILIPSALWMPLTVQMVTQPGPVVWFAIRLALALVALAALAMVCSLLKIRPYPREWTYWAALIGSILFFFHTAILDAIFWPKLFFQ
jgi:hypothetical protein